MDIDGLMFRPIDLDKDYEICLRFREDSFVASFGSGAGFHEADGKGGERYLRGLKARSSDLPGSCVHVWDGDRIVGQMEMRRSRDDPRRGYVNLFYLIPDYRDRGIGKSLEAYASRFFKSIGCEVARLTVSPTNTRARKFYRKHGWKDLGPHDDHPQVYLMEKRYHQSLGV